MATTGAPGGLLATSTSAWTRPLSAVPSEVQASQRQRSSAAGEAGREDRLPLPERLERAVAEPADPRLHRLAVGVALGRRGPAGDRLAHRRPLGRQRDRRRRRRRVADPGLRGGRRPLLLAVEGRHLDAPDLAVARRPGGHLGPVQRHRQAVPGPAVAVGDRRRRRGPWPASPAGRCRPLPAVGAAGSSATSGAVGGVSRASHSAALLGPAASPSQGVTVARARWCFLSGRPSEVPAAPETGSPSSVHCVR